MLSLRILSALVGMPLVLGAVYMGGPWYLLFLLLVFNLAIIEYRSLLQKKGYSMALLPGVAGVSIFLLIFYFEMISLIYPLVMLLFFILFVALLIRPEQSSILDSSLSFWGIIYIGGMGSYLLLLRMMPEGAIYTYILLAGVWIHDTLAYFIGVKWGIRKFAPGISPNKSVEGSLAGLFGTVLVFFSATILFPGLLPLSLGEAAILAFGIAVFAQLGDLMESVLKRQLEVKDSGSLIPGHGGVLDRFDSLFITAPFVYYFFMLV